VNKIKILVIAPAMIPSVNIGIIEPFLRLQKDGFLKFKVILPYMYKKSVLNGIDLAVFCRNSEPTELDMLKDIITKKIRYIYEIDDNFFRIPTDTLIGKYHKNPLRIDTLKKFISNASMIRVYSDILKLDIEKLNNNVVKNKLYFDTSLIENIKKDKKKKIRIIYATSRMIDSQQGIFEVALKKIAVKFKDTVEIYFWGAKPNNAELKKFKNVYHLKPIYNYAKFIKAFYKMNFDIGLAPIFEGKFYNSKTNNKYREYGACKIAGIYSNEQLYSSSVIDKYNGMIVNNTEDDWCNALEELITNKKLRESIIDNAKEDIKINYTFEKFCDTWKKNIEHTLNNTPNEQKVRFLLSRYNIYSFGIISDNNNKGIINCFMKNLCELYSGSSIQLNIPWNIQTQNYNYSNYDYREFTKNYYNIIIFSDNIQFIQFLIDQQFSKKNILVISTLAINKISDIIKNDNVYFFTLKHVEDLSLFTEHNIPNIYAEFHNSLSTGQYFRDKLKENNFIFILIKKIYRIQIIQNVIKRISYIFSKYNSIKLRLYTYIKIFKINYLS
jgi:hypothetical protein